MTWSNPAAHVEWEPVSLTVILLIPHLVQSSKSSRKLYPQSSIHTKQSWIPTVLWARLSKSPKLQFDLNTSSWVCRRGLKCNFLLLTSRMASRYKLAGIMRIRDCSRKKAWTTIFSIPIYNEDIWITLIIMESYKIILLKLLIIFYQPN